MASIGGPYTRENMIEAIREHALGHIKKHAMNVEVYLKNAAGVGEHPDILDAIEKELKVIAEYHDQLEVLEKYFQEEVLADTYTVKVEEDSDTGDLVLPLPTELLNHMGWDIGDDLVWNDNFNGTFSLSKKVDKEQEKAYNKDNE